MENSNRCIYCEKTFAFKQSLNKHLRDVHVQGVKEGKLKCPNKDCKEHFHTVENIRQHIADSHGVGLEVDEIEFQSFQDFKLWKEIQERDLNCQYVTRQSVKRLASGQDVWYYSCFRSGSFVSKSTGKRQLKSTGSRKISGCCPSSMHVTSTETEVKVKFWKTHYGHDHDIGHMFLPFEEKNEIACKLNQGVTFERILDDVRENTIDSKPQRIHFLTRKDLQNMRRDFKILNCMKPNNDEEISDIYESCIAQNTTRPYQSSCMDNLKQKVLLLYNLLDEVGELDEKTSSALSNDLDKAISIMRSLKRPSIKDEPPHEPPNEKSRKQPSLTSHSSNFR